MKNSKVFLKLDREGVRQMLKSKEAEETCKSFADKALNKLGEGYEVSTMVGRTRVNASVKAKTKKAKRANRKNNTILKAVCGK